MPQEDIAQLQSLIQAASAGWVAGVTSISVLSPEEQHRHMGYRGGAVVSFIRQHLAIDRAATDNGDWYENHGNALA